MKLKHILFVIMLAGFFTNTLAQDPGEVNPNGYNKFYYPNGAISSEGNLVNGKPDGIWKAYHENGNLKSEGNRINGVLEGAWKFYNEDGSISAEYNYSNGNKNGSQKQYYTNGKVQSDEPMVNGVKEGKAFYYSESGSLVKEVTFLEGTENGLGRSFAEDGRIIALTTYKNGYITKEEKINRVDKFNFKQGVWKEFYPDQKVKTEAIYYDDKLNGPFKYYAVDGSVKKVEMYKDGVLVIDQTADVKLEIERDYHNNGRVKSSVNIIDGRKQGVYREYDRQGTITASKVYRSDEVIGEGIVDGSMLYQGPWKFFYPGGALKSEGNYKDGKREGLWKFYYENGKLEQTGN